MADNGAAASEPLLFKVVLLGESNVGKSSLVLRYTRGSFDPAQPSTVGVDFAMASLALDDGTKCSLQIWDTAGTETFGGITNAFLRFTSGAFVVFDVRCQSSLKAVPRWLKRLHAVVHQMPGGRERIPVVLLANKCECMWPEDVDESSISKFAQQHGFAAWFATSAMTNFHIGALQYHKLNDGNLTAQADEAMAFLTKRMVDLAQKYPQPPRPGTIILQKSTPPALILYPSEKERKKRQSSCAQQC